MKGGTEMNNKILYELCETLNKELEEVFKEISQKGMNSTYLDYIDKMTHSLKSVKTIIAMESNFWNNHVLTNTPPQADATSDKAISSMYPSSNGTSIILPDEADDPFDIKYFEVIENVRLAKYLVLQKLVPEMVEEEYAQFVGYLIKKNYITRVSVAVMGESRKYHMLTSKGWHMVQQKDTLAAARATDPSFIIPEKLLGNPVTWEAETFLQAAILRKYYESLGISEFAIFIGDGDDQMLFGCEIRDSYSVSYSFAAYFVKEREKREAAILYEIAKSDKIDNLTLVLLDGK
jgi:hypothetical protein